MPASTSRPICRCPSGTGTATDRLPLAMLHACLHVLFPCHPTAPQVGPSLPPDSPSLWPDPCRATRGPELRMQPGVSHLPPTRAGEAPRYQEPIDMFSGLGQQGPWPVLTHVLGCSPSEVLVPQLQPSLSQMSLTGPWPALPFTSLSQDNAGLGIPSPRFLQGSPAHGTAWREAEGRWGVRMMGRGTGSGLGT